MDRRLQRSPDWGGSTRFLMTEGRQICQVGRWYLRNRLPGRPQLNAVRDQTRLVVEGTPQRLVASYAYQREGPPEGPTSVRGTLPEAAERRL